MLQWLACAGLLVTAAAFAADERLELHGHVDIDVPGSFSTPSSPLYSTLQVTVFGVESPYSDTAVLGPGGEFRFQGLTPGNYTIAIVRRGVGEVRRTVFVSAGRADRSGVVNTGFAVSLADLVPTGAGEVVSVPRIAIPDKANAKFDEARKRLAQRDTEGAIRLFQQAVAIAPEFSAAWNSLGVIAFQCGDLPRAEQAFRRAEEADPSAYEPLINLGGLLLKKGANQDALFYNERAVRVRNADALAQAQLGMSLFQLKQFAEAEKHLAEAKRLDPGQYSQPQLFLAEIYARRGERDRAIAELQELLQLRPDGPLSESVRRDLNKLQRLTGGGGLESSPTPSY